MKTIIVLSIFIFLFKPQVYSQDTLVANQHHQNLKNIAQIRTILHNYIQHQESVDSEENKKVLKESLAALDTLLSTSDLTLLLNPWLYYDPTDFPTRALVYNVLKRNPSDAIIAVEKRIKNPEEWEGVNFAQDTELHYLLSQL